MSKNTKNPVTAAPQMTLEQEVAYESKRLAEMESVKGRAKGIASEFGSDSSKKFYIAFLVLIAICLAIKFAG